MQMLVVLLLLVLLGVISKLYLATEYDQGVILPNLRVKLDHLRLLENLVELPNELAKNYQVSQLISCNYSSFVILRFILLVTYLYTCFSLDFGLYC